MTKAPRIRLYVEDDLVAGALLSLTAEQAHYLSAVMRQKPGDEMALFNGRDGEWRACLTQVRKKTAVADVAEQLRPQAPEPDLQLLFAPVKRGPVDFMIEKATELGVSAFRPVVTNRTVVTRTPVERLRKNAIEAAEQCGRLSAPPVAEAEKLERVLSHWPEGRKLMFCDEAGDDPEAEWGGPEGRAAPALEALGGAQPGPWAVLIGPEGGFSPAERRLVRSMPYAVPVTLGPRILRADTAAVAALTLWQAALGDLAVV
ncbi:MAG: 16S rRNA (uracil(1498)-N(3))-methyltransferase [Pseudomonadota bacterium]